MATTIVVVEYPGSEPPEMAAEKTAKLAEMQSAGKTDNVPIVQINGDTQQITRTWTTVQDAEEWIEFLEVITFNQTEATIIP